VQPAWRCGRDLIGGSHTVYACFCDFMWFDVVRRGSMWFDVIKRHWRIFSPLLPSLATCIGTLLF
jgi:hypothetical protein